MVDPPPTSELALMRAVAQSDPHAQSVLIKRLSARVLRLCCQLCGSRVDGEDAAQLALLEILRSAKSFNVETSLEGWMDRITVRKVMQLRRRERLRSQLLERWHQPEHLPWGTSLTVVQKSSLGLERFLALLPAQQRQAFVLRHALEYGLRDIAELTGAPLGTVKDRLVSARKKLRSMLQKEENTVVGRRLRSPIETRALSHAGRDACTPEESDGD